MLNRMPCQRRLFAQWRYLRLLLWEFRGTWLVFFGLWFFGALLFRAFDRQPLTGETPDFATSLHYSFTLLFMEYAEAFPAHWLLRIWYFLAPVLMVAVVSEALVRFGVLLWSREHSSERWVKAMVTTYHDHVILCGLGHLGIRILRELVRAGEPVVAVEQDARAFGIAEARELGVPVLIANARNERILRELNIDAATCVIAGTNDDLANLEIALDARQLKPGIRVVVRMFDEKLGGKIANAFDIKLIFSTTALAAPSFVAAIGNSAVMNSFSVDGRTVETVRLTIENGSRLTGQSIRQLLAAHRMAALSHRRPPAAAGLFPDDAVMLQTGDELVFEAEKETAKTVLEMNSPAPR